MTTLREAIDTKLNAARQKVVDLEAAVHTEIDAAKAEVAKLEADVAGIPEYLKDFAHDEIIAKVEGWFK